MDFIEILDMVPGEAYFARAYENSRIDLPFAGHVPVAMWALAACFVEKETWFVTTLTIATLPGEGRIRKAGQRV